jgi:hypothetical protein
MLNTVEEFSKIGGEQEGPKIDDRFKRRLARMGRSMFSHRLEIGVVVTVVVIPFVRPAIATKPTA